MEEKSPLDWEEHFPYDCIVGDQQYRTLNQFDHSLSISTNDVDGEIATEASVSFYLLQNPSILSDLLNKTVLALGALDNGLGGIAALKTGATSVVYTSESAKCIRKSVWSNVFLNCPSQMSSVRCLSATGADWAVLRSLSLRYGQYHIKYMYNDIAALILIISRLCVVKTSMGWFC